MSMLTNPDGTVKTYVTVDDQEEKILAAYNGFATAKKGTDELIAGGAKNATLHNLTHTPTCPDWLKAAVRADPDYCAGRAADFEARANALRAQAVKLNSEAADHDLKAQLWRADMEACEPASGPRP